MPTNLSLRIRSLVAFVALAVALTGCKRDEVVAYDIPKEAPPGASPANPHGAATGDPHAGMDVAAPGPTLKWGALPEGWTEGPRGGMRMASFNITGTDGGSAEMAIIPMGAFAGTDAMLVNMWRSQLGLPQVAEEEAGNASTPVTVGGVEGRQYSIAGRVQDADVRIVVASVKQGDSSYFFKLTGDQALVSSQEAAFAGFLKTIEFDATPAQVAMPAAAAPALGDQRWEAPPTWEVLPATQFLVAKYRVTGDNNASAEITVSQLGGAAGGMLPNVNRWRGQLNLAPIDQATLDTLITSVKAGSVDASLLRMEGTEMQRGTPARMVVVVVPLPGETWFFKMTGPIPLVEAREAEFIAMVNAARF